MPRVPLALNMPVRSMEQVSTRDCRERDQNNSTWAGIWQHRGREGLGGR